MIEEILELLKRKPQSDPPVWILETSKDSIDIPSWGYDWSTSYMVIDHVDTTVIIVCVRYTGQEPIDKNQELFYVTAVEDTEEQSVSLRVSRI